MAIYTERRNEIEAGLTHLMTPVMDGPATIRAAQRLDPEVGSSPSVGQMLEAARARVKLRSHTG